MDIGAVLCHAVKKSALVSGDTFNLSILKETKSATMNFFRNFLFSF